MRTVSTKVDIEYIAHANIDDTEKALIPTLELALVKDLDGDDGRVLDSATKKRISNAVAVTQQQSAYAHVEALVPVRVQRFLDHAGCVCLLGVYGDDRERVRESEHIALGKAIGRDDCNTQQLQRMFSSQWIGLHVPVILIFFLEISGSKCVSGTFLHFLITTKDGSHQLTVRYLAPSSCTLSSTWVV
jgi:hypothetical protein